MRNIKLLGLCLILCSVFALAVFASTDDSIDYENPDAYDLPGFYLTSDPGQWNFDLVDWEDPNVWARPALFNREDIYSRDEFYGMPQFFDALPKNNYGKLDYAKIKDYGMIADHSKINGQKYVTDMGCKACVLGQIDAYDRKMMTYSQKGIHIGKSHVSIPGALPQATQISVFSSFTKDNFYFVLKFPPEYTGEVVIPPSDALKVVTTTRKVDGRGYYLRDPEKVPLKLHGKKFIGGLMFFKGEVFVNAKDSVEYDGVYIGGNDEVQLLFEGDTHISKTKDYVHFGADELFINQASIKRKKGPSGGFTVSMEEGNPYIPLQTNSGEYDALYFTRAISFKKGTASPRTISIKKRKDMLPLVTIALDDATGDWSGGLLRNGETDLSYRGKSKISIRTHRSDRRHNSVPFALDITDKEGKSLVANEAFGQEPMQPHKLVFDNTNNVIVIPQKTDVNEYECATCADDFRNTQFYASTPPVVTGAVYLDDDLEQLQSELDEFVDPGPDFKGVFGEPEAEDPLALEPLPDTRNVNRDAVGSGEAYRMEYSAIIASNHIRQKVARGEQVSPEELSSANYEQSKFQRFAGDQELFPSNIRGPLIVKGVNDDEESLRNLVREGAYFEGAHYFGFTNREKQILDLRMKSAKIIPVLTRPE
jgi:hypothetical protein